MFALFQIVALCAAADAAPSYTVHIRELTAPERTDRVPLAGSVTILDAVETLKGSSRDLARMDLWIVRRAEGGRSSCCESIGPRSINAVQPPPTIKYSPATDYSYRLGLPSKHAVPGISVGFARRLDLQQAQEREWTLLDIRASTEEDGQLSVENNLAKGRCPIISSIVVKLSLAP